MGVGGYSERREIVMSKQVPQRCLLHIYYVMWLNALEFQFQTILLRQAPLLLGLQFICTQRRVGLNVLLGLWGSYLPSLSLRFTSHFKMGVMLSTSWSHWKAVGMKISNMAWIQRCSRDALDFSRFQLVWLPSSQRFP